jgi:hypothetical protein
VVTRPLPKGGGFLFVSVGGCEEDRSHPVH